MSELTPRDCLGLIVVLIMLGGSLVMAFQRGQASIARNTRAESRPRSAAEIRQIRQENARINAARNPRAARTAPVNRPLPIGKYK